MVLASHDWWYTQEIDFMSHMWVSFTRDWLEDEVSFTCDWLEDEVLFVSDGELFFLKVCPFSYV